MIQALIIVYLLIAVVFNIIAIDKIHKKSKQIKAAKSQGIYKHKSKRQTKRDLRKFNNLLDEYFDL